MSLELNRISLESTEMLLVEIFWLGTTHLVWMWIFICNVELNFKFLVEEFLMDTLWG